MKSGVVSYNRTKAKHPQTNGICERFHKTVLDEFYKSIFRKKIFSDTVDLQAELDSWMEFYDGERTHQGKRCQGRTRMATFTDGLELAGKAKLNCEEKLTA